MKYSIFILPMLGMFSATAATTTTVVPMTPSLHLPFCRDCLFINRPFPPEDISMDFRAGWGSKYECEGINAWETSYSFYMAQAHFDQLSFTTWYGVADNANHAEFKLRLDYKQDIGHLTVNPWYEHSFVAPGEYGVPRPGLELTWHFNDILFAGTNFYWQYNRDNTTFRGFYAAFAGGHYELTHRLFLDTTVRYGYNGGYVSSVDHHGSNNMDFNSTLTWTFSDRVSLDVFANYSLALTTVRQKNLGNDFYYGASLRFNF